MRDTRFMALEWPKDIAAYLSRTAEFSTQLVGLPFTEARRMGTEAGYVRHRWTRIQSADLRLNRIIARVDEDDVVTRVEVG